MLGLALNEIYVIDKALALGIDEELITNEVSEVVASTYYFFLLVAKERPEFITRAWLGAKLLYDVLWTRHGSTECP